MSKSQAAPGIVGPFAGLDVPWLLRMRAESRRNREAAVVAKKHPMLDEVPVGVHHPGRRRRGRTGGPA